MSVDEGRDQRARVLADRIGPDDPRYAALVGRGFNKRFAGKPDYVRLVHSTDEVVDAVQDAVREGRRVVARGGHCLEGFVDDPDVRVIIDTSLMTGVRYDPEMRAFVIDAGTTLGEVYRRLFLDWGVTLPAGESPYLGLGAHVSGGTFGFLCRRHGLAPIISTASKSSSMPRATTRRFSGSRGAGIRATCSITPCPFVRDGHR